MGDDELDLTEEGLIGGSEVGGLVEDAEFIDAVVWSDCGVFEVAVDFAAFPHDEVVAQEAGVASLAEPVGERLEGGGERFVPVTSMVVGVCDVLVDADHHCGAVGRANGI